MFQTGPNAYTGYGSSNYLFCGGIELYGELMLTVVPDEVQDPADDGLDGITPTFPEISDVDKDVVRKYLAASDWDVQEAMQTYRADQEALLEALRAERDARLAVDGGPRRPADVWIPRAVMARERPWSRWS